MDTMLLLKFFSVFAFVIGLMMLFSWVLKKIGVSSSVLTRGGNKRLKLIEVMQIDHKRRLVLIRRDDKEHLLVLGPESETVVEAGIPVAEEDKETTHVVAFARDHRNVKI
jgi:flagellar protein FliO/FliZ